jgi:predicted  nucleic acid-binding Zn-ribbon protein
MHQRRPIPTPAACAALEEDMSDIVERLNQYNPPDRTIDEQRQMSVDIHEAADEITNLRAERDQLRQYLDAAQRRGEELRAQVAALEVLLDDAIEEIEGWGEYAPAYFKQKHDLEGTLARFRAARKGEA